MRKIVLTGGCVLALAIGATAANAADIGSRRGMPAKEPRYVAQAYNWSGIYIGINGGGGWGSSNFSAPLASNTFDLSGAMVGGTIGYNWQIGQSVLGLEGDIDWSNVRGTGICGVTSCAAGKSVSRCSSTPFASAS